VTGEDMTQRGTVSQAGHGIVAGYAGQVAAAVAEAAHMDYADPDTAELARMYALLAMTVGVRTTSEHVHDAWSLWTAPRNPAHPALRPYGLLPTKVRDLDIRYRDAIRTVATHLRAAVHTEDDHTP
jgi:hypothetical protein